MVENVIAKIMSKIENVNGSYKAEVMNCGEGDFGNLIEIRFTNETKLGGISIWSSGNIFYHLVDINLEDISVIPEKHFEADLRNDVYIIEKMKDLFRFM